jgi:hypothetical protein
MLAKVCSAAVNGTEAYPIEVEVNAGYGDIVIVIVVNKTPKAAGASGPGARVQRQPGGVARLASPSTT